MSPLDPFAYPIEPLARVHSPAGYTDYTSYKPWLRDEFEFRCLYCLTRERWDQSHTGHSGFGVDHVTPQVAAPALVWVYGNLVYACNSGNATRSDIPLPLDPTAGLASHLRVEGDGRVTALTAAGRELVGLHALNSVARIAQRRNIFRIFRLACELPENSNALELFAFTFGYPADLPDLAALRAPGGNANPGSERFSHHARRSHSQLAEAY